MANKNGNAYGLTALFPLKSDQAKATDNFPIGSEISNSESLRNVLANMPLADASPFAWRPITHMSRFVVVDHLAFNGYPAKSDELQSVWLLWTSVVY